MVKLIKQSLQEIYLNLLIINYLKIYKQNNVDKKIKFQ